jgi:hypothetical protein
MKHLFSVHSPITFLIAHAAIEFLKLDVKDVIILSNGYKLPIDKYKNFPFFTNLSRTWTQKIKYLNAPISEDNYLNGLLEGENFIAYIDLMSYHQRIFITHSLCSGFHFIEEGNASYRDDDTLEDLTWDKRGQPYRLYTLSQRLVEAVRAAKWAMRGYSHRLISIPYGYTNFNFFEDVRYFCFSELAFPSIDPTKKVIVPLQQSKELTAMAGNISLSNAVIWMDGSGKAFTQLPDEVYYRAIDRGIERLQGVLSGRSVYVKLRPGLTDYSTNYLYQRLKEKGLDVSVMPNNLIIECVFANSSDCIVIGNLSSALFYANIFGHHSYSIYSLFDQKVSTVFDQMSGFWSKVEQLKNI